MNSLFGTTRRGSLFSWDQIEADLDKGVLTVKAAKRPEAKPRKILLGGKRSQKQLGGGDK
jgi:hypothetical protein